jgi:hypothetical protein
MSFVRAAVFGRLREAMQAEVRSVAGGLRRAVSVTGGEVQSELRTQARSAGFKDGGRSIANAWRLNLYPESGAAPNTFKPAALVWSRMPTVVDAFDRGAQIVARGQTYMVIPTGYNAIGGRRSGRRGGLRITPAQMIQAGRRGEAFVLPSKSRPGVSLWCLRVAAATGTARRTRNRLRLFVGSGTEVLTGHRKGQVLRRQQVLAQGFVPMFLLLRRVSLRKRLDVAAVARRVPGLLARHVIQELRNREAAP